MTLIVDDLANTSRTRFGANGSPGNSFIVPSGSPWMEGGLCVVSNFVGNDDVSIPANVVPAGWVNDNISVSGAGGGAGNGCRWTTYHKILTAADLGDEITSMQGDAFSRVCGTLFGFNRPLQTVTVIDPLSSFGGGAAPAALTVNWDSIRTGAHLYWGAGHTDVNLPDANYTWSPADVGSPYEAYSKGTVTPTRTYYTFYPKGVDPAASEVMTVSDLGNLNAIAGMLFRLT